MDIPSLISSAAAIFAVVYAKKAFDESRRANEIANKQLEEETKVEPRLYFPLVSKRVDNNPNNYDGYELLCVNNGKGTAIITDIPKKSSHDICSIKKCTTKTYYMHGQEIVKPNEDKAIAIFQSDLYSELKDSEYTQIEYVLTEENTGYTYEILVEISKGTKRACSIVKNTSTIK